VEVEVEVVLHTAKINRDHNLQSVAGSPQQEMKGELAEPVGAEEDSGDYRQVGLWELDRELGAQPQ